MNSSQLKSFSGIFFLFILFEACTDVKVIPQEKIYFSISSYIDQLSLKLDSNHVALQKSALLNGETDTSLLKQVNWIKELSIFKEGEINKSAYKGKFEVDSNVISKGEKEVTYRTSDKDIRAKLLQVRYKEDNSIAFIKIRLTSKNTLYESIQELELYPESGFSVEGYQSIIQFREDTFYLKGKFVFD